MKQMVGGRWINFEGVTETHLFWWNTSYLCKAFVYELRGNNCVFGFDRISGCQIIIFTCINDNASSSINSPGEQLIDKCAFHIDIAEDNSIEGIVEHHVETL